jgi:N4-gp56 family major capsid protein
VATTTYASTSNFSNLVSEYIQQRAEENLRSVKPWWNDSNGFVEGVWPTNTDTIVFPAIADIVAASSSANLTEGTMPTALQLAVDSESMTAVQKGAVVANSDVAIFMYPNLMLETADRIAENAALQLDVYARGVLTAGSNVVFGGSATVRTALDTTGCGITSAIIRKIAAKLRKANVPTFSDGTYHGILTEEQIITLQAETTKGAWIDKDLYSGAKGTMAGEVGQMWGVRFINAGSQQLVVTQGGTNSADVHVGLIFGPKFAGRGSIQPVRAYTDAGGGPSDVLHQKLQVGWKWMGGVKILSKVAERGYRVETVENTL